MAPELIDSLDPDRVRAKLDAVRARISAAAARAGRDPAGVEICVAGKYVGVEAMGALAEAGVTLVGENRAQDLAAKVARWGDAFTWDFIGHLQSRKVRDVLPHTRLLHAVSSDSVLEQLARHAAPDREVLVGENRAQDLAAKVARWGDAFTWDFIGHLQSRKVRDVLSHTRLLHAVSSDSVLDQLARHAAPDREVLVEVNVAGEASKGGVAPADLGAFIARCPVRVVGLMTMPPLADDPEDSRPWFAALRDLAAQHGLPRLSMGTTQDFEVAVEEGATIVRIGTIVVA